MSGKPSGAFVCPGGRAAIETTEEPSGDGTFFFEIFSRLFRMVDVQLLHTCCTRTVLVCTGITSCLPSAVACNGPTHYSAGCGYSAERVVWLQYTVLQSLASFVHVVIPAKALGSVSSLICTTHGQCPGTYRVVYYL